MKREEDWFNPVGWGEGITGDDQGLDYLGADEGLDYLGDYTGP
ncbi:hypothetical protein EniLVp02_0158 [Vibrio phage EniLVp02]